MKTAEENNVQLVIANDPDADRMCFAEKNASRYGSLMQVVAGLP